MDLLSIRIILVVVFILIFMLVMAVIFIVIYCKRKKALRGKPRPRFDRFLEARNSDAIQTFAFGQEVNEMSTVEPSVASSFMNENVDYFGGSSSRHSRYTDIEIKQTPHISADYNNRISRRPPLQQPDVIQQDRIWFHKADSPLSHFVYDYTYAIPPFPDQHQCIPSGIFSESRAQIHQEEEFHNQGCDSSGFTLAPTNSCSYAMNSHPTLPNTIEIVPLVHEPPRHLNDIIQNTPLARLSPISDSSQQQQAMRILTLQDISRKQQQTTLLDSTSSSGNVSKGVLPSTNSETSWNTRPIAISDWSSVPANESANEDTDPKFSLQSNLKYPLTRKNLDTVECTKSVDCKVAADIAIASPFDKVSSVTTESGEDDSFTCSEFEDDNANGSQAGKCTETNSGAVQDSFSLPITSEHDLATNLNAGGEGTFLSLDHLLSWGPNINYELFEGVCTDIAELPATANEVSASTTSNNENESSSNPMEIYV